MAFKKDFNLKESLAVGVLVFLTAVITFSITWWFLDAQVKENQEFSDQLRAGLQSRISQYQAKIKAQEEKNESNQVYKDNGFSFKYPNTWVYREYNGSANNLVAFADKGANLPDSGNEKQAVIAVYTSQKALTLQDLTTEKNKAVEESVIIGNNIQTTKWTLPVGRTNDLNGNVKIVVYDIPLKNGTFVRIQNINDQFLTVFNRIVNSFALS